MILTTLTAVFLFASAAAQDVPGEAQAWTVDYDKSAVTFTGEASGDAFDGEFETFQAEIRFDPDNLEGSAINASVVVTSINSGDNSRDSEALSDNWLNPSIQPEARFTSTDIRATADGYEAVGSLSVKGEAREFTLPFTVEIEGDTAIASSSFGFQRRQWNVGGGDFDDSVSDSISVAIDITATRAD